MVPTAPLMVTISGIRGIAGESLTDDVVSKFVDSFVAYLNSVNAAHPSIPNTVVIGRDSRVSGPHIISVAEECVRSVGYAVWNIGIVPTPTVQYMVKKYGLAGGIVVTSSHNPAPWNGLKFIGPDSLFIGPKACAQVYSPLEPLPRVEEPAKVLRIDDAAQQHVTAICNLPYIDIEAIRSERFTVAADAVAGAGGPILTLLLEHLGATVIGSHMDPTGAFPRNPEPTTDNLKPFSEFAGSRSVDLGVAVDPDVDRCVLLDESGRCIGEELTLAIAVDFILGNVGRRGAIVKNLSSSMITEFIAEKYGSTSVEAAVGEINVALQMVDSDAVIGGEGNGGVMLPDIHIGRDAPVAVALTLAWMTWQRAVGPQTMSDMLSQFPACHIIKRKYKLPSTCTADEAITRFTGWSPFGGIPPAETCIDGLKLRGPDWWVHVRKSNTEPIIRVIAEGKTVEVAETLLDMAASKL